MNQLTIIMTEKGTPPMYKLYDIEVAIVALERARGAVITANFGEHAVSEIDHLIAQGEAIRTEAQLQEAERANAAKGNAKGDAQR